MTLEKRAGCTRWFLLYVDGDVPLVTARGTSSAAIRQARVNSGTTSPKLVYRVEEVSVRVMESYPEQLAIEARGSVRNGGWTDAQLELKRDSGANGIYEFRFVARMPAGMVTQAITPIAATKTMQKPRNYRGALVIAETRIRRRGEVGAIPAVECRLVRAAGEIRRAAA